MDKTALSGSSGHPQSAEQRGFTIVEVLIAVLLLTVGLAALVGTGALLTRMIARGHRSATTALFAAQRLEQLRTAACTAQPAGSDTLMRGATWVAINSWTFVNSGDSTWRIALTSSYKTATNQTRVDQSETEVSCLL